MFYLGSSSGEYAHLIIQRVLGPWTGSSLEIDSRAEISFLPQSNEVFLSFGNFFHLYRSNKDALGVLSISCLKTPWLVSSFSKVYTNHPTIKITLFVLLIIVRPLWTWLCLCCPLWQLLLSCLWQFRATSRPLLFPVPMQQPRHSWEAQLIGYDSEVSFSHSRNWGLIHEWRMRNLNAYS